jgi:flavin reductase (DIM6/NTAB) family NADH-FMN oxidoreductase RutF
MNVATENQVMSQETKESIGKALGRVASGVYIITLGNEQKRDGMLATWISQAAFEPPMINVVVKKERPILLELPLGARFVVNVLGKKNMDIFKNFAKPHVDGIDRFAGLNLSSKDAGPVLTDAIAFMSCTVMQHVDAGDHVVVLSCIDEAGLNNGSDEPMVHLRTNGFQY